MKATFHYDELNQLDNGDFEFFYQITVGEETIYGEKTLSQQHVKARFEAAEWTNEAYEVFKRQLNPEPTETRWDFFMANEFPRLDPKDMAYICKQLWLLHFKNEDVKPLKEKYEALLNLAA